MSEVDDNSASTSSPNRRLYLNNSSGPIAVLSGEIDLFATGSDDALVPIATCGVGVTLMPPSPPTQLIIIPRIDARTASPKSNSSLTIQPFVTSICQNLGEIASDLQDATQETLAGLLSQVVDNAIAHHCAQFETAATRSQGLSDQELTASMRRAAYSAHTLKPPIESFEASPITAVMELLGSNQKFEVSLPSRGDVVSLTHKAKQNLAAAELKLPAADQLLAREEAEIHAVAHKSGIRFRTVGLKDGWHESAVTPFLGFSVENGSRRPVALIKKGSQYTIQASDESQRRPLNTTDLAHLEDVGFEFYTPFDSNRSTRLRDVIKIALLNTSATWWLVLAMALGVLLLGLLTPLLTSALVGTFIPQNRDELILSTGIALAIAAVGIFIFSLVQNFSISRITQVSTRNLQSAFWDRLLSLPAGFFRRFSSGELAIRALAIDSLSAVLSVQVVSSTLAALFGLLYVAQMFFYSTALGLVGVVFLILTLAVLAVSLVALDRQTVESLDATMESNGLLVQVLNGLSKLRIANAEDRFTARYVEVIRRQIVSQSKITVIGGRLNSWFIFCTSAAPALFYLTIYVSWDGEIAPVTTATFLAFYSAYTLSFGSIAGLSGLMSSIATVGPMYRLLDPLMKTTPESNRTRLDPGVLSGGFELRDVEFRYTSDGPFILRGLSMAVKPGELVALVGPSGAGKSTITRLLLDFEQPEGGQILFDGKDLSGLDPTLVRGQMGTVMQNGRISRSTVLINIMGSLSQDEDIAWAAAEQAAIADDIRAMPMGMHTLVDPSNISGGQAQRLLIARALVTKPRILLMDEATSALDNAAQAQVTDALARLRATRVVIAHRLSTIRSADRVIVLDRGVAVQSGTFDELVAEPGLFSDLVKRQTADTN